MASANLPEVSNPREVGFDVGCEESVLLSCGMYMCNLNGEWNFIHWGRVCGKWEWVSGEQGYVCM